MTSGKPLRFSDHARAKIEILRRHGLALNEEQVTAVVGNPDAVFDSFSGRKVAQGPLDERRVLRVVYEVRVDRILVVTFYPGERKRYEKDNV